MKISSDLSRRHFLSRAAESFLGVSALGSLPDWAFSEGGNTPPTPLRKNPAKRAIYLYMDGGMSHLDTFDPKDDRGVMGPTKRVQTGIDELSLSNNLPLLAKRADKFAVVRSIATTQGAHKQGNYFMHTSYEIRSSIRHPAMGAWLLKFKGRANPSMPGNVLVNGRPSHPGAGFFEASLSPLSVGNPEEGLKNTTLAKGMTDEKFDFNRALAEKLDVPFIERYDQKNVRAYTDMYDDAIQLMRSSDLVGFDISKEPEEVRKRYGKSSFGQGCLLARRLLQHGVSFVEVDMGGWDTHNANFVNVPELAKNLDVALSALLDDLISMGMYDDTLVILATEFGRTPVINSNAGRDHHASCFSCVLAGGGIKGGTAYGITDERAAKVLEKPLRICDFNATIAYGLGLPIEQVVFSPSQRPFTVAEKGKPVTELYV